MTQHGASAKQVRAAARGAAQKTARSPWVRGAAQLGYAAIGAVFLLLGFLALRVAFGPGQETPDQESVLRQILGAPFGRLLLGLVAVGFFGYLIWRVVEGIADLRGKGGDASGLAVRTGYALSGLAYGALGLEAARLALGLGGGSGDGQEEWTARLMALPFGRWLVVLAGAVVIGVGIYQLYKGLSHRYRDDLLYGQMSAAERKLVDPAGVTGHSAHGIALGLSGIFLLLAAIRFNPEEARGLGGSLDELARQPHGIWMLSAVALGLMAYGLYKFVEARYHCVLGR